MLFETVQLEFKPLDEKALGELLQIYNDPITMKYIPNNPASWNKEQLDQKLSIQLKDYSSGIGIYAVYEKRSGAFIGQAGIYDSFNNRERLEIGYILSSAFWNQGYGTEICIGLLNYCFKTLETKTVVARMYSNNIGSVRVAEKSGMIFLESTALANGLYRSTYIMEYPTTKKPIKKRLS